MSSTFRLVDSVPEAFTELVATRLGQPTGTFSLFLSGGSLAEQCYEALALRPDLAWGAVDVYMGDERCVPPSDPDSNHSMVVRALLDRVPSVHGDFPMYLSGSPEEAAATYQELLTPIETFDLVHLGVGDDGHTCSLFPESTALEVRDPATLVVANTDPSGHNPHARLTLTYPALTRSRLAVFTVSGAGKNEAMTRIFSGEPLPAARVEADEIIWLVDHEAAAGLDLARPPR